ncbi:hypothetical protein QVD17_30140 [Tagetes erecta]|uniref:HAT C-terminal dimerisation domain-containing protein n=1 Tax=Tagetes erecta TaxID=13708 RepID=A0AAD8K3M5_TARER|nr:hypothetical protein QVD17_30140 [Tagetes erecta]
MGGAPGSELGRYNGMDFISNTSSEEYDNFILAWWKGREVEYPVLSAMDRDLLSFQASTVALEYVFSTCGMVISLRRTRISLKAVEMCICLKDHLDAVDRKQDQTTIEDAIEPKPQIH